MSVFTLNYSCIPPLCRADNIHYLNAKLYEHACTFNLMHPYLQGVKIQTTGKNNANPTTTSGECHSVFI